MAQHKLKKLFEPQSIAVVGASDRDGSLGRAVWHRLRAHPYAGRAYPVNPKHKDVSGERCYARMTDLPERVDLALIAAPAAACEAILRDCGASGCNYALMLSHGFGAGDSGEDLAATEKLADAARRARVRLVGPYARGLLRPRIALDASAMTDVDTMPSAGSLAVLSQSGAWLSILRDYVAGSSIGFSSLLSLGASLDLDFGELLDYFSFDAQTSDVLLYIEEVKDAPEFMSGVRQISRMKPVVALKADRADLHRTPDGTHATALARHDRVFDAAIARAGAVRVDTAMQMVAAARLLTGDRSRARQRVAAITNGRGPGLVAADAVHARGLSMATLSDDTTAALAAALPRYAAIGNPVDIAGDATAERYRVAMNAVLADDGVDVCLVLFSPQSIVSADAVADEIVAVAKQYRKTVLAVMGGGGSVLSARGKLDHARIPQFLSAENAVDAVGFLETFQRNQSLLRQIPEQSVDGFEPHIDDARAVFEQVWGDGRTQLYAHEARRLLSAFGIAMTEVGIARTPVEAASLAESFGYPVVLKVVSPDVAHKTEVGGVQLDLRDAEAVRRAATKIFTDVAHHAPDARVIGLSVQPYVRQRGQRELYVGLANDPTFGAVIGFGAGGIAVERIDDVAFELPPLNDVLIANLIQRTRVARMLEAYGNVPAINRDALTKLMLRFSTLACMCPEIAACDLNPVVAYERGAVAVDARVVLRPRDRVQALRRAGRYSHLAVYPYPRELEETVTLKDGRSVQIRPIQPEDAEREREFIAKLSPETLYFRFMMPVRELSQAMIERFTQIDYGRELALVGVVSEGQTQHFVGVARITPTTIPERCEFAIVVGENMHGTGLAKTLMTRLFDAARERGYTEIEGIVLRENPRMLKFCQGLGFEIQPNPDDPGERIALRRLD
ncbi:MAG: bifunctional acetate--CoA ligase family protein/GNAT family N-acetyltransferase [Burkholderiales bacterium]|nr:bifunctional acetate--CoA ligase family protein/GNAT family N-acetyltransferase [Burkholderiales bacterium]